MKTVKLIANKAFSIQMSHKANGLYEISYSIGKFTHSKEESHYEIASALFDVKYDELVSLTKANSFLFS